MAEKGYELAGVEFDQTPPTDSDEPGSGEDTDHEPGAEGDEEGEEDQGVD